MKDFNIQDEAGGVHRALTKNFTTNITENTLEIHFYWGGKGTTAIPNRGVYGPLISAISVTQSKYFALQLNLFSWQFFTFGFLTSLFVKWILYNRIFSFAWKLAN